ncbi:uncharacterized protein LOC144862097 [Branchiostoma floridae x Branchiostoma japonicum]
MTYPAHGAERDRLGIIAALMVAAVAVLVSFVTMFVLVRQGVELGEMKSKLSHLKEMESQVQEMRQWREHLDVQVSPQGPSNLEQQGGAGRSKSATFLYGAEDVWLGTKENREGTAETALQDQSVLLAPLELPDRAGTQALLARWECVDTREPWDLLVRLGHQGLRPRVQLFNTNIEPASCNKPQSAARNSSSPGAYRVLDEAWRNVRDVNDGSANQCDRLRFNGEWYRFMGPAGSQMPSQRPATIHVCGTDAPMWLNGTHPTVADGEVSRQVCAYWSGNPCRWQVTIQVKACPAGYYVYKLPRAPACYLAYCGETVSSTAQPQTTEDPILEDCAAYLAAGNTVSGVYTLDLSSTSVEAYCDMDSEGGGWTVIQRRQDGSVPFNRNWEEYKLGFGNKSGEYWLGNENIHLLTMRKNYKLRITLEDWNADTRFAEYSTFRLSGESDGYRLHLSGYSGTAGDTMAGNNGQRFSTVDRDNDASSYHCSQRSGQGGWWFRSCGASYLNGRYLGNCGSSCSYRQGVMWYHWRGFSYSLKSVSMKIRP